MLTREQAIAELTAPGAPCEVRTETVNGHPLRVFTRVHPTLRDLWLASVSARGDATYFVYDDVPLTYGEAHQQVVSLAAWLAERGIGKGDRVAIGMRNYPEWAVAFWAVECVGAVVVSLNAWWITEELEYALNDSGAIAAIVDGERSERLPAAMLARTSVQNLVTTRCQSRPDATPWEDATGNHSATLPRVEIAPDDDATILYTSGTTGFPKGAVGSHRNYKTNVGNAVLAAVVAMKIAGAAAGAPSATPTAPAVTAPKPQVRALATFPFFHIAGLCGLINNTNNGVCVHTMFKWDAGEALALIERHRVNVVGGVPTVVRTLLEHPDFDSFDLSSITSIGQGGAPVPPDSIARIETEFAGKVNPSNGYGLTETTAAVIANAGAGYFAKKESVGLPAVGCEVRIVDEDGNDVPVGETGELWLYGPSNVRGYWNKPEATAGAFIDGWFRSGDAARMDADGYIYVVDRIKDMVLRGGENVYCVEVETALFEHPAVLDCAVIGLPHDVLGEEVAAVVVAAPGHGPASTQGVREHLAGRLAVFKVPSAIFWHEGALPRNASGKVLKRDLRDTYADAPRN
ncbi:MAG: class I adenylate-forming enzyme family protein [Actinomycetota bacterium]